MLHIDGKDWVQTGAILRFLARRGGLYGEGHEQNARCVRAAPGLHAPAADAGAPRADLAPPPPSAACALPTGVT